MAVFALNAFSINKEFHGNPNIFISFIFDAWGKELNKCTGTSTIFKVL